MRKQIDLRDEHAVKSYFKRPLFKHLEASSIPDEVKSFRTVGTDTFDFGACSTMFSIYKVLIFYCYIGMYYLN